MAQKTIEQERAAYALNQIMALQKKEPAVQKAFVSYAAALPAMIRMNGFGQALAFCRAKSSANGNQESKAYESLYQLISGWLCKATQPYKNYSDVLEGITQADMAQYRLAQAETLALMAWVVKLAKAFLGEAVLFSVDRGS